MQTTSNTELRTFNFSGLELRIVSVSEEPWFIAADVCRALSFKEHSNGGFAHHLYFLAKDESRALERSHMPDLGLFKGTSSRIKAISESGLYKLIMRSDKPEARKFQDWVTKEVLPAIRKTGDSPYPRVWFWGTAGVSQAPTPRSWTQTSVVLYPAISLRGTAGVWPRPPLSPKLASTSS